ncbi:unnamed protein product [Blepharisma stoltei]|uniref:Uncharacterized protein n=1 Tax=Blepharisma stoltei TaxID=1481888 RepID=A0AAU9JHA8_9CILI|nr:unnamed protein product [Blepharisma stoltei]
MKNTTEREKPHYYLHWALLFLSFLAWIASFFYTIFYFNDAGEYWKNWLTIFIMIKVYLLIEVFSIVVVCRRKAKNEVRAKSSNQPLPNRNFFANCACPCKLEICIIINFIIWVTLLFLSIFRFDCSFISSQAHEEIVFVCVVSYIKLRAALELYGFIILFIETKGRFLCEIINPAVELFRKIYKSKKFAENDRSLSNSNLNEDSRCTRDSSPVMNEKCSMKKQHSINDSGEWLTFRV